MNETIRKLLAGQEDNHVMPFFWQHGEDEATLREMMAAIHGANCRAVCVESRPHPDFCGEKWWQDMDVILDEARRRDMKVWILDDSHFPTGFANGAVLKAPDELCKEEIFVREKPLSEASDSFTLDLRAEGLLEAPKKEFSNPVEAMFFNQPAARVFAGERVLGVWLVAPDGTMEDIADRLDGDRLTLDQYAGDRILRVLVASRNAGYHQDYISMTNPDSVRLLIEAVYEPHWQHYAADFGKTIAGFFSDEPELGNGFKYEKGNVLGKASDLPWSELLEKGMRERLGDAWRADLTRLWSGATDPETARVHFIYMDELTRLVRTHFSEQLGDWCRAHGVAYIGHVIEDDGQHCRTGSSLGHYFRGLQGQDMAGIDDIGGQVLPQGEDEPTLDNTRRPRSGLFYHYGLAKLAQSAAAIERRKQGRAMCEIFGNYGWEEGVRLEKYLADHFLVRGINYFVPHAFTGMAFPDPDCPPHFYAHGHNPQYRHFGEIIRAMNRTATLTSAGRHRVPVAILYHGEAEWCDGEAMPFEAPLRRLYDWQIDCHVLPADVFTDPAYDCTVGNPLWVGEQAYQVFVVPGCASLCGAAAQGLERLAKAGLPVLFAERRPDFVSETGEPLPETLAACPVLPLEGLADAVLALGVAAPELTPACDRVRMLEIESDPKTVLLVNEGRENWTGTIRLPDLPKDAYFYDPWRNRCLPAEVTSAGVCLTLEPLKSLFLVYGVCDFPLTRPTAAGEALTLGEWRRSLCESVDYPHFSEAVATTLPDGQAVAAQYPEFSGFVRYESHFTLEEDAPLKLEIESADEGVEVFLDGQSLGIQVAPPFVYDFTASRGEHTLAIEVATTLERATYPLLSGYRKMLAKAPSCASGITGNVRLCRGK